MSLCLRSVAETASGVNRFVYHFPIWPKKFSFSVCFLILFSVPVCGTETELCQFPLFPFTISDFGGGGQRGGKEAKRAKEKKEKSEREKVL